MSPKMRRLSAVICAIAMTASVFSACGDKSTQSGGESVSEAVSSEAQTESTPSSEGDGINAVFGDIRTEFNNALDLSDYPLTPSEVPADFTMTVEAENGALFGSAVVHDLPEASGGGFVNGINLEGDELKMTADIPCSGFYDLNFQTMGSAGRVNNVLIDGMKVGDITTNSVEFFGDTPLNNIYLEAGIHEISITPSWGYVDIDCVIISAAAKPITEDTYKVTAPLSNPNADENAQRLYKFLCDVYGKYSLAGQYAEKGRESSEFEKITKKTGKS
ncbi:MAG: CBM35 domain-containing protein, partial [Huintestinicola sp.]